MEKNPICLFCFLNDEIMSNNMILLFTLSNFTLVSSFGIETKMCRATQFTKWEITNETRKMHKINVTSDIFVSILSKIRQIVYDIFERKKGWN